ncbi:hypothetical protein [Rudaea cellulosilytica]|uniref:hypothetical protein n=1 Tax=Rudaea cellulosilytica TaxID=540746 RepID=UPI000360F8CE|nr:hypothetical protein [Rudaea cellulosilytica]
MQYLVSPKKLLAGVLLLCLLAYARGLVGGFVLDDFPAIVNNPALRNSGNSLQHWLTLAFSSSSGILRRPISMLSFGLDNALFGLSPFAFKAVNLLLHLLNGILFFLIAQRISPRLVNPTAERNSRSDAMALIATAIWLAHPLHVSNVLYVVQRMNLLSALFCLLGLFAYVEGRLRIARSERGLVLALGGLILALPLAILSKENGALLFAYAFVVEFVCFRFAAPQHVQRLAISVFFVLTLALPLVLFSAYLATHPQWLLAGYTGRDFTLTERLMSEARILTDYIAWTFIPLPAWMGIFHDDFVKSSGLLQPPSTLYCIVFWVVLVVSALIYRRRAPAFSFAILWFLAGHSMESTILPLELVFDHRNYLPMAGFLLGLACWIGPKVASLPSRLIACMCVAMLLVPLGITAARAYDWSSEMQLAKSELDHHPQSSRALYVMGQEIIFTGTAAGERSKSEDEALPYFERVKAMDSADIYSASSALMIMGRDGKELPPSAIDDLARRIKNELRADINPFLTVLKAATDGSLRIDITQMEKLVYSALDNPVFTHSIRAAILSNFAHYQFQRLHDAQSAVSLALAATAEDPTNPLFQMDVTQLALALGNVQEAQKHLDLAKQLNKAGLYDRALRDLANDVSKISASP